MLKKIIITAIIITFMIWMTVYSSNCGSLTINKCEDFTVKIDNEFLNRNINDVNSFVPLSKLNCDFDTKCFWEEQRQLVLQAQKCKKDFDEAYKKMEEFCGKNNVKIGVYDQYGDCSAGVYGCKEYSKIKLSP